MIELRGLQLSLTLTPPKTSGTAAWQFPSAKAFGVAEQITVGAVLSVTVKVVVQVALLPASKCSSRLRRPKHSALPPGSSHRRRRSGSPSRSPSERYYRSP